MSQEKQNDGEPRQLKEVLANMPSLELDPSDLNPHDIVSDGRSRSVMFGENVTASAEHYARERARREQLGVDLYAALRTMGCRLDLLGMHDTRLVLPFNKVELALREGGLIKDGQAFTVAVERHGEVHVIGRTAKDRVFTPAIDDDVVSNLPIRRTDDADALEQSYIDNPRPRKVRNSCVFGHRETTKCYWCAHAKLNTVTTGQYNVEPTLKQLEQLNERNDFTKVTVGNMPLLTYLRDVASGEMKSASFKESIVEMYRAFLIKHHPPK